MRINIWIAYFVFIVSLFGEVALAQKSIEHIHGNVYQSRDGNSKPLAFANVFWAGTSRGAVTDENGFFHIDRTSLDDSLLVASFVGFRNDTIPVSSSIGEIRFYLSVVNATLDAVEIEGRQDKSFVSKLSAIKSEHITTAGLQQLACCNLSESFENSATVDVGYSDAVSGARQIQMLGLAGVYSQLMFENMPFLRGLSAPFGLSFVPGSWMQSIQISKGTASVINGYESITGQINVEYWKPEHTSEQLNLNLYGSHEGRAEANFVARTAPSEHLSTLLFGHVSMLQAETDHNRDGFLDMPRTRQFNFLNRWTYEYGEAGHSQIEVSALHEDRFGGSVGAYHNPEWREQGLFAADIQTRRYQGFLKTGFMLDDHGHNSIGWQVAGTLHSHDSRFGDRVYNAHQESFYTNLILQLTPGHSGMHKVSTGLSYQYDFLEEEFLQIPSARKESVPGLFAQYTFEWEKKLTLIAGFRTDFHNRSGTLHTPRFHMRWQFMPDWVFRASAGKGYRAPVMLAENLGYLSSSREIVISNETGMEEAWNYGFNLTRTWHLADERKVEATLDFYRTSFLKQWLADADQSVRRVVFTYSGQQSYSSSLQAEIRLEPLKHFTILTAFRWNDVKSTLGGELKEKPFVFKYKGLINLSYSTRFGKWQFDLTGLLNADARIPSTIGNPVELRLDEKAPSHVLFHAQITRRFKNLDIYAGSENLGDFRQNHPVLDPGNPYGPFFDASLVWGPVSGRMFYAGLRYRVPRS